MADLMWAPFVVLDRLVFAAVNFPLTTIGIVVALIIWRLLSR